ncbi:hypothetical protein [Shouchella clausii]|uniref:hypothetical protein n=1 Tax=Shouchella clausii TaxID=79880 RepID=UPI001C731C5F|nr:hypothetical protein [Shouchella clausii]MBX0320212.1 hypothetical protein [Shouchella clausii]
MDIRGIPVDPIINFRRKGTADDPFLHYKYEQTVALQKVTLREIPSKYDGVKVTQGKTTLYEMPDGIPDEKHFVVDYSSGEVHFHPSHNNKAFTFEYMGTGVKLIPDSRVYTKFEHGRPTETLNMFIDNSRMLFKEIEKQRDIVYQMIRESKDATNRAIEETNRSVQARSDLELTIENSLNLPQRLVKTIAERNEKYPRPKIGWTVEVTDENTIYRFDGVEWVPIGSGYSNEGFLVVRSPTPPLNVNKIWLETTMSNTPLSMKIKPSTTAPSTNLLWLDIG